MMEARDSLEIPQRIEALSNTTVEIEDIIVVASQLREGEGDSSSGKRYGLLVEGFKLLKEKLNRIPILIERKEYSLAAKTIDEVAIMNRLWTGQQDSALTIWAETYRERASQQEMQLRLFDEKLSQEWLSGNLADARATLEGLLNRKRELYGDSHSKVMETLISLWEIHFESGLVKESSSYLADALAISRQIFGEMHWKSLDLQEKLKSTKRLADSSPSDRKRIYQLWANSMNQADINAENIEKILALADREIGFAEQTLGHKSSLVAESYVRFARLAAKFGKLNYAVAFYLRGASTAQKVFGDQHPLTCSAVENWSRTCRRTHDNERAFNLSTQAVHMNRKFYGEGSEEYLVALANHGVFYYEFASYPQARQVLKKVERIRLLVGDKNDLELASVRHHLGLVSLKMNDFLRAQSEFEAALKVLDGKGPLFIEASSGMVSVLKAQGKSDEALKLQSSIVGMSKEIYGRDDIRYAYMLENLATMMTFSERRVEAARILEESLAITRKHLDRLGKLQGVRLRINAFTSERTALSHYLSIASELGDIDELAYHQVSIWKSAALRQGRVFAQSQNVRPDIIYDQKLQSIADAISNYLTVIDTRADDSIELARLNEIIQAWEDVNRNAVFQEELEYSTAPIEKIKMSLPANAVLIDFFQYRHFTPSKDTKTRPFELEEKVLAFIIRRDRPVKMISIGTVDEVEDLVSRWRKQISGDAGAIRIDSSPAVRADQEFSNLVWGPIAKSIGNAKHVIICPDGMLSLVPWAATPINKNGKYLIESSSVSVVPYADFLIKERKTLQNKDAPSMTLVGNLDYRQPFPSRSVGRIFTSLPGTAREIDGLRSLFNETFPKGRLTNLERQRGSELNFRKSAMTANYLHVATHGFFVPEIWETHKVDESKQVFRERIRVMVPQTLSALVLSGANRGLDSVDAKNAKSYGLDGILTGLEVFSMDLRNIDLVTLSACETSIGTISEGTGKLGLEHSFHAAGANSVVSSLWKVDDAATATLMVEFYKNLWSNEMSKAESLRSAQLALINRYDRKTNTLHSRGLKLVSPATGNDSQARLPPYFWAPFILSGDWE